MGPSFCPAWPPGRKGATKPSEHRGAGGRLQACAFSLAAASTTLLLLVFFAYDAQRSHAWRLPLGSAVSSLRGPPQRPAALADQGPDRLLPPEAPGGAAPEGPSPRRQGHEEEEEEQPRRPLLVLLWRWPFGPVGSEEEEEEGCSRLGCRLTTNHSRYEAAEAVLMYHRDICCQPQLLPPGPRPRSQLWVWFNMDPPSRSGRLASLDHLFNLTMSFRRDSDIFAPFGWLRVLRRPQNFTIPPKSKLAATVSSHWPAGSRPATYLAQLRRHLPVDTYGHPERVLPAHQLLPTLSRYRFYLAFESSAHQDYLTRQLWRNALLARAVPVVLGPPRENYERHLPPEAFIHVDDFPTAQQLARFLQELAGDPARYRRYFRWRTWLEPQVERSWAARLCKACRVLREKGETFQPAPNLSRWFT